MTYTLFCPLLGMFLLTLFVTVNMAVVRFKAIREGRVDVRYFKTYEGTVPPELTVASRHFNNLFEIPVLFYAAMILAMTMNITGTWVHVWAWMFLTARVVHALIHLYSNKIMWRMRAYSLGWIALIGLWTVVSLEVFSRT